MLFSTCPARDISKLLFIMPTVINEIEATAGSHGSEPWGLRKGSRETVADLGAKCTGSGLMDRVMEWALSVSAQEVYTANSHT